MTLRVLERSNSWPQYAYSAISRKRLDLETPFQRTTNRKWHGLSNGRVIDDVTWPPKVLWGSNVGYPSDSLASCSHSRRNWFLEPLSVVDTTRYHVLTEVEEGKANLKIFAISGCLERHYKSTCFSCHHCHWQSSRIATLALLVAFDILPSRPWGLHETFPPHPTAAYDVSSATWTLQFCRSGTIRDLINGHGHSLSLSREIHGLSSHDCASAQWHCTHALLAQRLLY